jgi:hypothetical protein
LQPDPLGYLDGPDPYSYVQGDPINKVDPLGLYEEDIHYYMTYFLAMAAGVDPRMAYIIATGDQYVDNNPATYPLAPSYFTAAWDILTNNAEVQNRLASYHFTQTPDDDLTSDPATRYYDPKNPQLTRLFNASKNAGDLGSQCAKAVMYGEYLHAFEDTFAHRRYDNRPVAINAGFGHAVYGHFPDHTYNETQIFGHDWSYNEDRSLEAEHEVFERLRADWGATTNQSHTWEEIEPMLKGVGSVVGFNATKEDSSNTSDFAGASKKVDMLNDQLKKWGYQFVGVNGDVGTLDLTVENRGQYKIQQGQDNRNNFLRYKDDSNGYKTGDAFNKNDSSFEGSILP